MSDYHIRGIQQIGIGVESIEKAFPWYRKVFGADIILFDDDSIAEFMLPYTGNQPQKRRAILAVNLMSGGGFEIWQYKGRKPQAPDFEVKLGDLGINIVKIKAVDVKATHAAYKAQNLNITELLEDPQGNPMFFITDPFGNRFQIVQGTGWFRTKENKLTGLTYGAILGVHDIDETLKVYRDILGYDVTVYDREGKFEDLSSIPGGQGSFRRVLLRHSEDRIGGFGRMFGPSEIELVQALDRPTKNIFEGRFWGDLGFIHLCFDVMGMDGLRKACADLGHPFTVDSQTAQEGKSFEMGDSAGLFSYIEDGGGTLIEFVEAHKLPLIKKVWELDLKNRPPKKPVPAWIIKALRFTRTKE
ncbi:MAG: VOC family protein [Bacteroidota bacterium]|nr:VOC family protein [Bacteroidota bacterium]MDX5447623.1 VOC family protein [Bacteroidota bacterium]MDX5505635.1 VOC family protein [Bacteroidota bacterium]